MFEYSSSNLPVIFIVPCAPLMTDRSDAGGGDAGGLDTRVILLKVIVGAFVSLMNFHSALSVLLALSRAVITMVYIPSG